MKEQDLAREDESLRIRFAAMRAADHDAAPSFDAVLDSPRTRSGGLASALGIAGVVAGFVAVVAWMDRAAAPDDAAPVADVAISEVMLSVTSEMPSDFLLVPPSDDVRQDVPRLRRADNEEVPFL